MAKPEISVIMGVYNSEDKGMVRDAINSILSNNFPNFEFVICDDCSIDDTWQFLNTEYAGDERVVLIRNETNGGLRVALNRCLAVAQADYVVRQDADDVSRADRLSVLYEYMKAHPKVDVLGTAMISFDKNGEYGVIHPRKLEPQKKDFLPGTVVAHASTIMKKSSLEKVKGYRVAWETTRCEDTDLYMRMFAAGCIIRNIDEALYCVRQGRECYSRKKYIGRVKEAVVKYKGFKVLKMPFFSYIYVLRPIIVGLIPAQLQRKIKNSLHKKRTLMHVSGGDKMIRNGAEKMP